MDRQLLPGLAVFVEVAESLSFSQAATHLGVNASSVSRTVARLEEQLGVKLLRRTSRAVALTQEGRLLFERCRDAFFQIDEAGDLLQGMRNTVQGTLRATVPLGIGRKFLLPALPSFVARYPHLRVEVLTTDRKVDLLYEDIDVAVRVGASSAVSNLRSTLIRSSRFVCVASPDYWSRHPPPKRPDQLARHACVAFRLPSGSLRVWEFEGEQREPFVWIPSASLVLDDGMALVDAVASGVGVGYVPDYLVQKELSSGHLVEVMAERSRPAGDIRCVYMERRQSNRRVQAFVDFVQSNLMGAGDA